MIDFSQPVATSTRQRQRWVRSLTIAIMLLASIALYVGSPQSTLAGPSPAVTAVPLRTDLVAFRMGGNVDKVSSEWGNQGSSWALLDDRPSLETFWGSDYLTLPKDFPQEIVFSFFEDQAALVSSVVIHAETSESKSRWAKDVEVWTSMDGPDQGFAKIGQGTLRNEPGEQTIAVTPTQARFVMLRILSNYGNAQFVRIGKVKVIEGRAAGYVPLLQRNPDLAALIGGAPLAKVFPPIPPAVPAGTMPAATTSSQSAAPPAGACMPAAPVKINQHNHSSKVLVVTDPNQGTPNYPPLAYKSTDANRGRGDMSIYGQLNIIQVIPKRARPTDLLPSKGFDTVVLSEICDIKTSVTDDFKRALVAWVAEGHKLIIADADFCGKGPDYSFLPYAFGTGNAGANAASSDRLIFVEENSLADAQPPDPSFLDTHAWLAGINSNHNELGDSNLVNRYDAHWCGSLFTTNVKHDNGFAEAYAHVGNGLIIYDGFDHDQRYAPEYKQLVTRELWQSYNPDGLPCGARMGDFIVTTEQSLKTQPMVQGKTYTYPLTLLSNQGYQGQIKLALMSYPADQTLTPQFNPQAVDLTEISNSSLIVHTTAQTPKGAHMLEVRGTDANGKSNALCLALTEPTTGGIRVVSDLHRAKKPTKNLELILDLSGSMRSRLGNSTRIGTARKVLRQVLATIPDDFNVGLRFYANRYAPHQKESCTDTQLVAPIQKLDRNKLLALVDSAQPRGMTPLVYSVLQTPADLKAVGGGSVILITDGQETCHGDPVKAAEQLKQSGIDVTLDIVGFTLTGQKVQQELSNFAEATGGHYYEAQNADTLARALLIASTSEIPYAVFDALGKQVAHGEAGDDGQEVAPGDYRVVITAAGQQLVAEGVQVAAGTDAKLTVTLRNNEFALESPNATGTGGH